MLVRSAVASAARSPGGAAKILLLERGRSSATILSCASPSGLRPVRMVSHSVRAELARNWSRIRVSDTEPGSSSRTCAASASFGALKNLM
jgi:hypothetical protein